MRTGRVFLATAIIASFGIAVFACGPSKKPPPKEPAHTETVADAGVEEEAAPPPKSLYERLGGKEGLAKVIDTLMKNVAADAKINKRFAALKGKKLDDFKQKVADFICKQAQGDCTYAGKDMKEAHKGMKIKDDEWNAFLADFKAALDEHNVSGDDQAELVSYLGPMKEEIVEVKPKK